MTQYLMLFLHELQRFKTLNDVTQQQYRDCSLNQYIMQAGGLRANLTGVVTAGYLYCYSRLDKALTGALTHKKHKGRGTHLWSCIEDE